MVKVPSYYLRIVTAHKDNKFIHSEDVQIDNKKLAMDEADNMQRAFDIDSDPVRVYVLGTDKVPIYAGLSKYF